MNKLIFIYIAFMGSLVSVPIEGFARSGGPEDGLTNSPPNRQNCTECHSSFAFNSGQGALNLQGLPEAYEPGETYRLTLRITDPNARRWGFELTALNTRNARAGNIASVVQNQTFVSDNQNQPQYLKHRSQGTFPGQANNASWQFDWTAPAEGTGRVTFYYTGNAANNNNDPSGDRIYGAESPLSEAEPPPPPPRDSLIVSLMPGWNLISSSVLPDSIHVARIFGDLLEAGSLIVLRDVAGRRFRAGVDEIGEWEPFSSYVIKISNEAEVKFSGEFVDPAHSFMLTRGWNWISYTRNDTVHPSQVNDLIGFAASLIRDGRGNFAIPGIGASNLPMIEPGMGLQMLGVTDEPYEFIWPEPNRELESPMAPRRLTHFEAGSNTGASMSLVIAEWNLLGDISDGDELGVATLEGVPVGAGVLEGEQLLLTIWGDDNTTEPIDGALAGDSLVFTYWYAAGDSEEVTRVVSPVGETLRFERDGVSEARVTTPVPDSVDPAREASPGEFALLGLYPNPFNPTAEISFVVPVRSLVSAGIYDLSGRLIRDLGNGTYEAGKHSLIVSGEGLPAGMYLIGVESGGLQKFVRAVLLR